MIHLGDILEESHQLTQSNK